MIALQTCHNCNKCCVFIPAGDKHQHVASCKVQAGRRDLPKSAKTRANVYCLLVCLRFAEDHCEHTNLVLTFTTTYNKLCILEFIGSFREAPGGCQELPGAVWRFPRELRGAPSSSRQLPGAGGSSRGSGRSLSPWKLLNGVRNNLKPFIPCGRPGISVVTICVNIFQNVILL